MDIQKERESYLKMLVGNDAISNDQADTLKLMSGGSHFCTYGNQVSVAKLDLINWGWNSWVNAKSQAVPEGFVLVPTEKVKYFSHDGENYEIHNTLAEAKHEAECAIEHFSERLADQLCDPRSDGNFHDVGYGIVLGKSGYSVDHIVTKEDVENGEYGYEAGTEIMSLFLVDVQEQSHE